MSDLSRFLARAEGLLDRLDAILPVIPTPPDWGQHIAFRWQRLQGRGQYRPVARPHRLRLEDLRQVERQKRELDRNTRQFLAGLPANNALLWGPRGTGKSTLIKAILNEHASRGLRLIEVDKTDLMDLPEIVDHLYDRPERFILFCDDLSFEAGEAGYKALKAILDGSISTAPDNVLVYATSNRRHLLPEMMAENLDTRIVDGELHHGEAVEEKVSLSERFGLWLSFHPFSQDDYLSIVDYWLGQLGGSELDDTARKQALQWALTRGSRSGRVAFQFAKDWTGRQGLET